MTSIIIASDDHAVGQAVAEFAAVKLKSRLVDRSLLKKVAARYKVPEDRLERVLDATAARRFSVDTRRLLLAYIESVTLEQMQDSNVVCTGLSAHVFARGVSHLLLVRVLADQPELIKRIAKERRIPLAKAQKEAEKRRESRSRWSLDNFLLDECKPSIYDMVISLGQIEVEKVVDIVMDVAAYRRFQPMTYSRMCLANLLLANKLRIALLPEYPNISVQADGSAAIIHAKCASRQKPRTVEGIKKIASGITGVDLVEVHTVSSMRKLEEQRRPGSLA